MIESLLFNELCEGLLYNVEIDRLCYMSIHAAVETFFHIVGKGVRSHCYYRQILIGMVEFANSLRRLVSVHDRHTNVHKYRFVCSGRGAEKLIHADFTVFGALTGYARAFEQGVGDFPV